MGLVIFFIMIVAAFNIVGTLTMVVTDKTREIGILQAMGVTGRSIGQIFLLQGALIGAVGTFARAWRSGWLIAFIVDRSGWVRIDPSVYFIDRLPVHVQPLDVLVVLARELPAGGRGHLVSRRAARRGSRRSTRSGTSNGTPRGAAASARCTRAATASRSMCSRAPTSASPGVSSWRSWARAGRGRARCSTCSARWIGPPAARYHWMGASTTRSSVDELAALAQPEDRVRVPVPSPAAGVHARWRT